MSRKGRLPVELDGKIKSEFKDSVLVLKGPLGEMSFKIPDCLKLKIEDHQITVETDFDNKEKRMMAGTARSIINNNAFGITKGFDKQLELVGVGYRAQQAGQKLTFQLGFSHPVEYQLPDTVQAEMNGNTKITLKSCDKQLLGQVAAEIRAYRPPEPYKGKGVLYGGEIVKRKAGKTGKGA